MTTVHPELETKVYPKAACKIATGDLRVYPDDGHRNYT